MTVLANGDCLLATWRTVTVWASARLGKVWCATEPTCWNSRRHWNTISLCCNAHKVHLLPKVEIIATHTKLPSGDKNRSYWLWFTEHIGQARQQRSLYLNALLYSWCSQSTFITCRWNNCLLYVCIIQQSFCNGPFCGCRNRNGTFYWLLLYMLLVQGLT